MSQLTDKMQKTVDVVKGHLGTLRTGRANPEILSKIMVEYYGSLVPLQQVAAITVPESTMLMLNIFDKGATKAVEKAIQSANLGFNPNTDGSIIRLKLPDLTEERRKELVKLVKKHIEDGKVSLRNIRRDEVDSLKAQEKAKTISEDESKTQQDSTQKTTDKFIGILDQLGKDKEAEIMTI